MEVADAIGECLGPVALFCPASGDTPGLLYQELARRVAGGMLDVEGWQFVGLDEWVGMNGEDPGSCRNSLDKELFEPLQIDPRRICFFDGRAADPENECALAERFIREHGRIDLAVLGIGMNGHIAMNEPGTDIDGRSHVVELHPVTRQTGQKYFNGPRALERGITLGMGTLLDARHIFLLAVGGHKASVVQRALEGPVTAEWPASLLRQHAGLRVFLDREAASALGKA